MRARTLHAHVAGAPRCTEKALSPGDIMVARTRNDQREIGDALVIVAIVPVKPAETSFHLTTLDKHGMHGPREVAGDWFTWDDSFQLIM